MKKRQSLLVTALAVTAFAVCGLVFMACSTGDEDEGGGGNVATVTFALGYEGGTAPAAIKVTKGESPEDAFPEAPVRADFRFDGWYSGSIRYYATTTIDADITLTAHWTAIYTVTFDLDYVGATDTPAAVQVYDGLTLASQYPAEVEREGFAFVGWFDGETKYTAETPITANVTLKAHWFTGYFVNLDTGFPSDLEPIPVEAGGTMGSDLPTTVTGPDKLTFAGWYDGDTEYTGTTAVNADGITLKARWNKASDVAKVTAKNNARAIWKFTVPGGGQFGDYTKVTVKFLLDNENFDLDHQLRLYGNYPADIFELQQGEAGYYFAAFGSGDADKNGPYILNNFNSGNAAKADTEAFGATAAGAWFTVELPLTGNRHSAYVASHFPADDATGDFYFGLCLASPPGGTDRTSYMTEVTLSNDEGTKTIVSTGSGFDAYAYIGNVSGDLILE
jgi:uncharacterized repeat protein (TIGR02543 family)